MSNDAALMARQEDDLKTQIAQGDTSKLKEMVVNRSLLPGALAAEFQVAADAVASQEYQQKQEVFIAQQDAAADQKQAQADKDAQQKQQEAWLANMTPEYRQAYADLQATVADAHKEYDHLRQELQAQRQQLDAKAKEIDDNALHLSDGSRAYRDAHGKLVDKDGKELTGKDAQEAQALLAKHVGPVSLVSDYGDSQKGLDKNTRLTTQVNTEQTQADGVGKKAGQHGCKTPAELAAEKAAIARRIEETKGIVEGKRSNDHKASGLSLDSMSDLDGTVSSAPPPHSSYASQVDPNAGIHANGVTTAFNAATQGATPQVAPAATPAKPTVSLPAPA